MEGAVVDRSEVSSSDSAVTIMVEFSEGSIDHSLSLLVRASPNSNKELIVVELTVLVGVEVVDKNLGLTLRNVNSHVLDAPVELLLIEHSVATIIHDFEDTSHASDGLGAALLEANSDLIEN